MGCFQKAVVRVGAGAALGTEADGAGVFLTGNHFHHGVGAPDVFVQPEGDPITGLTFP